MKYKLCPKCSKRYPIFENHCESCNCQLVIRQDNERNDGEIPATAPAAADARDNTAGQPQNHACCDPHATRVAAAWLTHSETGIRIPVVPGENIGRNHPHFGARLERFDTISRTHCRIDHTSTGFSVTDTGSRNGTWINGTRLQTNQPAPLANGDRLLLADHEFLFEGA